MTDDFDPYRDWLGIAAPQRPPSHYALLGLAEFESDAAKIAGAADARMREVRNHQTGPRGRFTQKLLNELSLAKLCLLDVRTKAAYDAGLKLQRIAPVPPQLQPALAVASVAAGPPVGPPPPVAPPPLQPAVAAPPKPAPTAAEHEEHLRPREERGWWIPLAVLFVLVIVSASGGMYLYSQRSQTKLPEKPKQIQPKLPQPEPELVIAQEGSGDLNLPLSVAELTGGVTSSEAGGQTRLENWNGADAAARWKFKLVRPAVFQVRLEYDAASAATARWQLRVGDETKVRDVTNGAVTDEFFWRIPRGGTQELEFSLIALPDEGKVQLKSLRFTFQGGELK